MNQTFFFLYAGPIFLCGLLLYLKTLIIFIKDKCKFSLINLKDNINDCASYLKTLDEVGVDLNIKQLIKETY